MSEPINIGDLVVIVKPLSCCGAGEVGLIFRVANITDELGQCKFCGTRDQAGPMALHPVRGICQLWRLKRIPDFPELLDEKRDEEITA